MYAIDTCFSWNAYVYRIRIIRVCASARRCVSVSFVQSTHAFRVALHAPVHMHDAAIGPRSGVFMRMRRHGKGDDVAHVRLPWLRALDVWRISTSV